MMHQINRTRAGLPGIRSGLSALFLALLAGAPAKAQTGCGFSSGTFSSSYKVKESFIPRNGITRSSTTPKKIRIRFVVLEVNPTGTVQQNYRPADTPALQQMVTRANYLLSHIAAPWHPPSGCTALCHTTDSRLQLELTDIEFLPDTHTLYNVGDDFFLVHGRHTDSVLNIYVVTSPTIAVNGAWTIYGSLYAGPNDTYSHYMVLRNYYSSGADMNLEAGRLAHELGHTLGNLGHYDDEKPVTSSADFLSDIFGSGTVSWAALDDNNFMFGHHYNGSYFSPLQMSRIHRMLHLGSSKKYAYTASATDLSPWIISTTETWDFAMKSFQDIRITDGDSLKITCELQMPPGGKIVVETGGHLSVNGGTITPHNVPAVGTVLFDKGFEVQPGASLDVR